MITGECILFLIFAHFIADWALQSDWVAKNKSEYSIVMMAHCMVWTGVMCFTLKQLGMYAPWKPAMLFGIHYVMDSVKCDYYKNWPFEKYKDMRPVYIDQIVHIIQCVAVGIF